MVINSYIIREPIWNGSAKKRMIGIATSRMQNVSELRVQISKRNKHKELIYPYTYVLTPSFFHGYAGKIVSRYGVDLKYFFIEDLMTVDEHTFITEAKKYGDIKFLKEIKKQKKRGNVNGKSNTRNNKYKPPRTQI